MQWWIIFVSARKSFQFPLCRLMTMVMIGIQELVSVQQQHILYQLSHLTLTVQKLFIH